jgi:hypothetical protein
VKPRLCTMIAIATSSIHRSGVVRRPPSLSWSSGLSHAAGSVDERDSRRARSASGTDHAPAAASANARRRRTLPFGRRTSIQWLTSSSRTSRRWTASMSNARHSDSSGDIAAESTTARGRHENLSGPRSTTRSSVKLLRRIVSHATSRDRWVGGTRTWTRRLAPAAGPPCSWRAVGPESQLSGPAYKRAATCLCGPVGRLGESRMMPGSNSLHARPSCQRIWARETPDRTS